jgi:hypothetical protein
MKLHKELEFYLLKYYNSPNVDLSALLTHYF